MNNSAALHGRALSYCVQQVRKYDYKHYLCVLQLPPGLREVAFALRAFNVETAMVKDSAKQSNLAMIRLVWWRDAIDGLYKGAVLDHPVLKMLGEAVQEHRLSKHWFTRIVEARMADLDMVTPPRNISEVEQYTESTASALLYLTLEAAGVRNTNADHAASHTGKTAGLALLLQGTPFHCASRTSYIPLDVAAKHGVSQEDLYRGKHGENLSNAVFELASVAHSHLEKARELAGNVPKKALPVLLPAVPADQFLESLMKSRFDPFDPKLQRGVCGVSPLWMLLKLKWYSLKGIWGKCGAVRGSISRILRKRKKKTGYGDRTPLSLGASRSYPSGVSSTKALACVHWAVHVRSHVVLDALPVQGGRSRVAGLALSMGPT